MRKLFEIGGLVAAAVLIAFGIAAIALRNPQTTLGFLVRPFRRAPGAPSAHVA